MLRSRRDISAAIATGLNINENDEILRLVGRYYDTEALIFFSSHNFLFCVSVTVFPLTLKP